MTRLKRKKELPSIHEHDVRFGTPQDVAAYRAQRLAELKPDTIIEVGAGAGFQTQAFAKRAQVIAIDIDAARMERGNFPENSTLITGDALAEEVLAQARSAAKGRTVVFLDPERPPSAEQRRLGDIRPDIREFLAQYGAFSDAIAIELPPFLTEIPFDCEREYLSINGKLNRLTVYTGSLKRCDVSVVQLPSGERIEHSGPVPEFHNAEVRAFYLLEPDAALIQAELENVALNVPARAVLFGRKLCYFTETRGSKLFTHYRVRATGKDQVMKALARCGTIILHGSMSQAEQRDLLGELNRHCKGTKRLHLFIGHTWCLAEKTTTPE